MAKRELAPAYSPKESEDKWYQYWLDKGYFRARVNPDKEPYCMVIPPPNITGILHMGHAMEETMHDILVRWHRMDGYETLWLPGTDHASIATEAKVVEALAAEGLTKYDIGRDRFLERVWEWKRKYGGTIINQLKRLGASCDWDRERFTMDEGCSRAVRDVFTRLYRKGLIYRGDYIVNWCPVCQTTISDIEVEHQEHESNLWHIKYPIKGENGYVIVATTRPETMLGDTAVAVNPNDERYRGLVGKTLILPIMNREIPIIADEFVEVEFGTGAVKVTPAHDPNDFEMGLRHNLPCITVIGKDGTMTPEAGRFRGQDRYDCRKAVVEELESLGLMEKIEPYMHSVGQCYRCDSTVEPLISKQWFVRMKPLVGPAIEVVKDGRIEFVPGRFTKIYLGWLENIRDWCISRQLWWGHRIPAWYCGDCDEVIVSMETPQKCPKCGSSHLQQDEDVLDTWFSSALWPFSTLGWPDHTPELDYFYPTSVLVNGRDIIFFWVARMIFMAMEFMGKEPFHKVVIHGLVTDAHGRKMSKSSGNSVDPLEAIDEYGTDALRLSLITGNTPGADLRFYREKTEGYRNFANKLWNAARFVLMNIEDFDDIDPQLDLKTLPMADRWILSRYNGTVAEVTRQLERFDLGAAAQVLYDFVWSEFCDWYIEMAKPRLRAEGAERRVTQGVLTRVLRGTLELLHPFMPFITEEIWQQLPHRGDSIMVAPWPKPAANLNDAQAEADMTAVMEITRGIRNIRAEMNVAPARKVEAIILASQERRTLIEENGLLLQTLAGLSDIKTQPETATKPEKAAAVMAGGVAIYLPLAGLIDLDKECERLEKEYRNMSGLVSGLEAKLGNPGFLAKAPAEVVEKERAKLAEYAEKAERLKERLEQLRA